jgi:aminopeptidase N
MITTMLAVAALLSAPDSLMGPGVSIALARWRAAAVRDVRYDLQLDVTARDSARGFVAVHFALAQPRDVVLDFRGPRLTVRRVNDDSVTAAQGTEWNHAHLRIPAAKLAAGRNDIVLEFSTPIAAAGASIIKYHDPTDGADYLYTLLVPSDANLLFPCFDQPDLKARVSLSLVAPPGWAILANGRERRTEPREGAVVHEFAPTEPISTYLIAFAAGPWKVVTARGSTRPVRLYVRASRASEAEADSIILANDKAATWLADYFAVPFPFQKLDVLLAPAFPFGGMEHPGAIFYNEDRFIYRERPTLTQRLGRTATIYHEVAHQWFGDYTTMKWFDDLWLKEGFATYMAAKMQAALDTSSGAWKSFYLRNKPQAYAVDATSGTTPVWQELANLDQAKSNYGAIVYNKAPAVLKQLNYLVGDSLFRDGLQRFLRAHQYGNATWRDLLDAVATARGQPLRDWGAQYILRPGMPVLEQRVELEGDRIRTLMLIQRPARTLSGAGAWPIRTQLVLAYAGKASARIPVTITGDTTIVRAASGRTAPDFVFANDGDNAYALVLPDERSVAWLEQHIGTVPDAFLRAMLWGAMWDLVREARLAPERFVALATRELVRERDEQIVAGVIGRLTRAASAYLSATQRGASMPGLERALRSGAADSTRPYGIRKAYLDAFIRVAETRDGIAELDALLDSAKAAGEPLRPPTRWAIVTTLVSRDASSAAQRLAAETRRDSTSDGRRRAFVAAAARPSVDVKRTYFQRYFGDANLNEDWATASLTEFNSLRSPELSRPYLLPALDSLQWIQRNRRIFFLGSWLSAFLEGQTSRDALTDVNRYLSDHADLPRDLREKVLQSADELDRTVRIRERYGDVKM